MCKIPNENTVLLACFVQLFPRAGRSSIGDDLALGGPKGYPGAVGSPHPQHQTSIHIRPRVHAMQQPGQYILHATRSNTGTTIAFQLPPSAHGSKHGYTQSGGAAGLGSSPQTTGGHRLGVRTLSSNSRLLRSRGSKNGTRRAVGHSVRKARPGATAGVERGAGRGPGQRARRLGAQAPRKKSRAPAIAVFLKNCGVRIGTRWCRVRAAAGTGTQPMETSDNHPSPGLSTPQNPPSHSRGPNTCVDEVVQLLRAVRREVPEVVHDRRHHDHEEELQKAWIPIGQSSLFGRSRASCPGAAQCTTTGPSPFFTPVPPTPTAHQQLRAKTALENEQEAADQLQQNCNQQEVRVHGLREGRGAQHGMDWVWMGVPQAARTGSGAGCSAAGRSSLACCTPPCGPKARAHTRGVALHASRHSPWTQEAWCLPILPPDRRSGPAWAPRAPCPIHPDDGAGRCMPSVPRAIPTS